MGIKYSADPAGHRFVSHEDIRTKLSGCWIYYKGTPVYVKTNADSSDYKKIYAYELGKRGDFKDPFVIDVTDKEVDMKNFPQGWFNVENDGLEPGYCVRVPTRMYKQGVTESSLMVSVVRKGLMTQIYAGNHVIDRFLRQEFPDSFTAVEEIKKYKRGVALSSDVALIPQNDEIRVYVGKSDVGIFHQGTKTVEVTKPGMYSVILPDLEKVGLQ